jgi:hypothetical protein
MQKNWIELECKINNKCTTYTKCKLSKKDCEGGNCMRPQGTVWIMSTQIRWFSRQSCGHAAFLPMLHVRPSCMSQNILSVHFNATCPCLCCMSILMLLVNAHTEYTWTYSMDLSCSNDLDMQHGHWTCTVDKYMLFVYSHWKKTWPVWEENKFLIHRKFKEYDQKSLYRYIQNIYLLPSHFLVF